MSGAAAERGTWPAKARAATSASSAASGRAMSLLLVGGGGGLNLRGRGRPGRQSVAAREMHDRDLLLLLDDDLLGQPLQSLVLAVAQLDERHVDGALVVRDHHAGEVPIRIACEGDVHRRVHARDRIGDQRLKAVRAGGRMVAVWGGAASRDEGERQKRTERQGRAVGGDRSSLKGHVLLLATSLAERGSRALPSAVQGRLVPE